MKDYLDSKIVSKSSFNKPLGEILIEAGLISAHQIEMALLEQMQNPELRIGEILAIKGWIKQETADFFAERWLLLLTQEKKHPLIYYFREAAILDASQIDILLEEQKQRVKKIRFHRLALEKGWIERRTVDFFLENLFVRRQTKKQSFALPYELLKNYIRGETDFQQSELEKVQLNNVTLKGVNLDGSNLAQAELNNTNFTKSSLRKVNLQQASLEKAILTEVDWERACLQEANLRGAHLEGANFEGADLQGVDLRDAHLFNARFLGADLRGAKIEGQAAYGAYYDRATCFDANFSPKNFGWNAIA